MKTLETTAPALPHSRNRIVGRRQERYQRKVLMSKTIAMHVRFESLYISLPSAEKQQREMTEFYVFWKTRTAMANFSYLLELNAVGAHL